MEQTILLIGLFFCHFLADFTWLSTDKMLKAKKHGTPLYPIFVHAYYHMTLTALFMMVFSWFFKMEGYVFIYSNLFLLITHFIIDVWKGKMNVWFPKLEDPNNKLHWVVFGLDQYLHALVIILISYYIIK